MVKILINDNGPAPDKLTGISTYLWNIVRALIFSGKYRYVLTTNRNLEQIPDDIVSGLDSIIMRANRANETIALLSNTMELPKIAKSAECSLIFHVQPTAMLRSNPPSVVVVHDLYRVTHPRLFGIVARIQWNIGTRSGIERAAHIIAVSKATRHSLAVAYPHITDKISVVHEASPVRDHGGPIAISTPNPYILYVANITANKNVGQLVRALRILGKRGLRPKVLHVGRDEHRILELEINGDPTINIQSYTGVSEENLKKFYREATIYVNTSLVEGFCLPILEAQTFGVPVICSDIDVLREVAGLGAKYVTVGSDLQLADAIEELYYSSSERLIISDLATRNAKRFSWEKAAAETEVIFGKVLAKGQRVRC